MKLVIPALRDIIIRWLPFEHTTFFREKRSIFMSFLKSLGHASLGTMFIIGGWGAFSNPGGRVDKVASVGIPRAREATILNAATMMVAGTTLAAGILPRVSAAILIGSLIPTTYVGHAFWKEETPAGRTGQQTQFLKNLAMIGGLLVVLQEG
jgi:putative oxidoreductase